MNKPVLKMIYLMFVHKIYKPLILITNNNFDHFH